MKKELTPIKELRRMPSDAIRLHFWSADKSCHVVTDCISEAKMAMRDEYDNVSIATSQNPEISHTDIELYYL
jgi:hypothetical protein